MTGQLVSSVGMALGVMGVIRCITGGLDARFRRSVVRRSLGGGVAPGFGSRRSPRGSPWAAARDVTALRRDLPAMSEAVARRLRAGNSLGDAVAGSVTEVGGVIGRDLADLTAGRATSPLAVVVARWRDQRGLDEVDRFAAVITMGVSLGGELAPAFEATARALRDRLELADEVRSLTAQSRASAGLLSGLPVVAAVGMGLLDPASGRFLVGSAAGFACLAAAVAADAVGLVWMRSLIRGAA